PLCLRAGAAVPVQPVVHHTAEMSRAPLSLVVAADAGVATQVGASAGAGTTPAPVPPSQPLGARATASRVYEDAGEGYDYRRGAFRVINVTVEGNAVRLARSGAYNVSRPLASVEILGLPARPREVRADGRRVEAVTYDAATRRLFVPLPAEGVAEIIVVP
ncbi:MAG TPA: DUF5110 domain-containing protein, partial [Pyrinomonadaceae bacterium]|nr:DUF5110 domain-containing protein [Pyrinomonadaceae bacterium]